MSNFTHRHALAYALDGGIQRGRVLHQLLTGDISQLDSLLKLRTHLEIDPDLCEWVRSKIAHAPDREWMEMFSEECDRVSRCDFKE